MAGPRIVLDLRRLARDRPRGASAYALPLATALLVERPRLFEAWESGKVPASARLLVSLDGPGPVTRETPAAVTLLDASHLLASGGLPVLERGARSWRLAWAARRAEFVIAPSATIEAVLRNYMRVPPHRILHLPPRLAAGFGRTGLSTSRALRQRLNLPERYFLFVGTISRRKNLGLLATAFEAARPDLGPEVGLVIAGSAGGAQPVAGDRITDLGYVPAADLPALLSGAIAYVNPSLHEGSPIGTLEALACGIPALVSSHGSLAEPLQGGGIALDPADPVAWAAAMVLLTTNAEARAGLAGHARSDAAAFSARGAVEELSSRLEAWLAARSVPR